MLNKKGFFYMIITIRKQLKTKLLQSIFLFFMGIFFIFFILPDLSQRMLFPSPWIMRVNNTEIEQQDFDRVFSKHEANLHFIRDQYGQYATMFLNMLGLSGDLKQVALDELVKSVLLDSLVKDIPLYIQEAYLTQRLNNIQLAQRAGITQIVPLGCWGQYGLDQKRLQLYLKQNHLHLKQFESLAQQAVAHYIATQLIEIGVYQPTFMINNKIKRDLSLRKYAVITLPLDSIIQEERAKNIADDTLRSFFNAENKKSKRYWVPEKRSGRQFVFDPVLYGITITDTDLNAYYKKYSFSKYIKEPAQVQVRRILLAKNGQEPYHQVAQKALSLHSELLKDPSLFQSYARQYSDDKDSAQQGGLLPLFAKGQQDAVLEKKAFLLNEDGQISDVFESSHGFEIIQRVQKKAATSKSFAEVKKDISNTLLSQEFAQRFNADMKHYSVNKTMDQDSWQRFVLEKKATATTMDLSAKDASKSKQALFRLKKKDSFDFYIDEGKGYVVLLDEIHPAHEPSFETVKAQVVDDYILAQAHHLLPERIKAMIKEITNKKPSEVARAFGARIYETGFINPKESSSELYDKQIPMDVMFQVTDKDEVISHIQNDGYIFKVIEVKDIDSEQAKASRPELLLSVYQETSGLFVQGFVDSLARNAKIEFSELLSSYSKYYNKQDL